MANIPYRKFECEDLAAPKLTVKKNRFIDHLQGFCPVCQDDVSDLLICETPPQLLSIIYRKSLQAHLDVKYDTTRDILWKTSWFLGGLFFFPIIGYGLLLGGCIMKCACLRSFWLRDYCIQCKNVADSGTSSTGRRYRVRCNAYWKPTDEDKEIVEEFYKNRRLSGLFWLATIFHVVVTTIVVAIVLITFCTNGTICSK